LPLHTAEDAETWTAFFKASLQLKEKIGEKKNELSSFKNSFVFSLKFLQLALNKGGVLLFIKIEAAKNYNIRLHILT
jgi:hypothetical protein